MRLSKLILLFSVGILLLPSCIPKRQVTNENPFQKLNVSEQNRVQFDYLFHEATSLYMLRLYPKAISYLNEALKFSTESGTVHFLLSKSYIQINRLDSAFIHAQKAASLLPENEYIVLNLAQMYYQNNEMDKAIELYDKLINIQPQRDNYYLDLATIYIQVKQFELAIETFDKYQQNFGITEEVSIRKNQLYTGILDPTSAYNELNELIKSDPYNARYYGIMAEYLIDNQRFDEASQFYSKALEIDPNNGMINLSIADFQLQQNKIDHAYKHLLIAIDDLDIELQTKLEFIYNALNNKLNSTFNKEQLSFIFDKLDLLYPENKEIPLVQADFYIDIKEYRLAANKLQQALKYNKSSYKVWEKLFQLDFELQAYSDLLKHAKEALDYFPNQPYVYLFAGLASENLNNEKDAVSYYLLGAEITVDNPKLKAQFFLSLADYYHRNKDHRNSDLYFDKVLEVDPINLIALNNYSYYLSLRAEKMDKALQMSKKIVLMEPYNATYLDTRAWVLFVSQNFSEALKVIEEAITYGGDSNTEILDHYAQILLKNNQKENAIAQWKKLLQLDPSRSDIVERLNKLE